MNKLRRTRGVGVPGASPATVARGECSRANARESSGAALPRAAPTRRKYGNQPIVIDGIRFASRLEAAQYVDLRDRQARGEIRELKLQDRLSLAVNGIKVTTYVADFTYWEPRPAGQWKWVVQEAKGRMTDVARLKLRHAKAQYCGTEFRIIGKGGKRIDV